MEDAVKKLDLMKPGTRYDHYVELREVFAMGAEVIRGLLAKGHDSLCDRTTLVELDNAVKVINKRLAYLSDYEKKTAYHAELPTTIRGIDIARKADAKKAQQEIANHVRSSEDKSQPPLKP